MPTLFKGPLTRRPSTVMVPDVAASNPEISFNSVDLPQPLAPTNATVAPRGTSSETPSTARVTRPFATYSNATSDSATATSPLTVAELIEPTVGRRRQVCAREHLRDGRLGRQLERDDHLLD